MEINVYDMLVFEDESGNIYQDCVCSIDKIEPNKIIYFCNSFEFQADGFSFCIINKKLNLDKFILKEIWRKTDKDTYKKVWSKK